MVWDREFQCSLPILPLPIPLPHEPYPLALPTFWVVQWIQWVSYHVAGFGGSCSSFPHSTYSHPTPFHTPILPLTLPTFWVVQCVLWVPYHVAGYVESHSSFLPSLIDVQPPNVDRLYTTESVNRKQMLVQNLFFQSLMVSLNQKFLNFFPMRPKFHMQNVTQPWT